MLAAKLPKIIASRASSPAHKPSVNVATTVSPAPVTSKTSFLLKAGIVSFLIFPSTFVNSAIPEPPRVIKRF